MRVLEAQVIKAVAAIVPCVPCDHVQIGEVLPGGAREGVLPEHLVLAVDLDATDFARRTAEAKEYLLLIAEIMIQLQRIGVGLFRDRVIANQRSHCDERSRKRRCNTGKKARQEGTVWYSSSTGPIQRNIPRLIRDQSIIKAEDARVGLQETYLSRCQPGLPCRITRYADQSTRIERHKAKAT